MDMVDSIKIQDGSSERYISFWQGDMAEIPVSNPVDLIIVSAFRNSYTPAPSSIIGALHRKGLSVEKLAENKAIDPRDTSGFWLSRPLQENSTPVGVRRILCFEPHFLGGQPNEVVGNLFRGLFPFLSDTRDNRGHDHTCGWKSSPGSRTHVTCVGRRCQHLDEARLTYSRVKDHRERQESGRSAHSRVCRDEKPLSSGGGQKNRRQLPRFSELFEQGCERGRHHRQGPAKPGAGPSTI